MADFTDKNTPFSKIIGGHFCANTAKDTLSVGMRDKSLKFANIHQTTLSPIIA